MLADHAVCRLSCITCQVKPRLLHTSTICIIVSRRFARFGGFNGRAFELALFMRCFRQRARRSR